MGKTRVLIFVLVFWSLFSGVLFISFVSAGTIYVPDNYTTIQEAVDVANPGDTIFVSSGIYILNSTLNIPHIKTNITLEGAGLSTILKAKTSLNDTLIAIYGTRITIRNMKLDGNKAGQTITEPWIVSTLLLDTVQDALVENIEIVNSSDIGLHLSYPIPAPNATLRNIKIDNSGGVALVVDGHAQNILLEDIKINNGEARGLLVNTAGGTMKNIQLKRIYVYNTGGAEEEWYGSGTGIHFDGNYGGIGKNIRIEDTIVNKSGSFGVWVIGEAWNGVYIINSTVENNRDGDSFTFVTSNVSIINSTSIGSYIDGFALGNVGSTVNGISITGSKAINSGLSTGGKGFMLYRVMNSSIVDSEAIGIGGAGFFLRGSQNNRLIRVHSINTSISMEEAGITLLPDIEFVPSGSYNNTLIYSTISNNKYALSIDQYQEVGSSNNNIFYHNNFLNNVFSVYIFGASDNRWDNGYPSGGNYWSNYNEESEGCYDLNNDEICDSPYIIDYNNQDNYPFTNENGWLRLLGDVNRDCKVDIFDLAAVGLAFGSSPGDSNWNAVADLNKDGSINIFDLATVGINFGKSC